MAVLGGGAVSYERGIPVLWLQERLRRARVQVCLAHKKLRAPLGSPQGPRHSPTVGSYAGAVSCERGTPCTERVLKSGGLSNRLLFFFFSITLKPRVE